MSEIHDIASLCDTSYDKYTRSMDDKTIYERMVVVHYNGDIFRIIGMNTSVYEESEIMIAEHERMSAVKEGLLSSTITPGYQINKNKNLIISVYDSLIDSMVNIDAHAQVSYVAVSHTWGRYVQRDWLAFGYHYAFDKVDWPIPIITVWDHQECTKYAGRRRSLTT